MKTLEKGAKTEKTEKSEKTAQAGKESPTPKARKPFKKGDKTAGFWRTLFPYMKPFKRNIIIAIILSMMLVHVYGTTDSRYIFAMLGAMGVMEHTFRESVESCLTQVVGVLFGAALSLLPLTLPIHSIV